MLNKIENQAKRLLHLRLLQKALSTRTQREFTNRLAWLPLGLGTTGSSLTLTGSSLAGTTASTFVSASGSRVAATSSFTVNAAGTRITGVVVPAGAATGTSTATTAAADTSTGIPFVVQGLAVLSTSPASASRSVAHASPVQMTFSQPLTPVKRHNPGTHTRRVPGLWRLTGLEPATPLPAFSSPGRRW